MTNRQTLRPAFPALAGYAWAFLVVVCALALRLALAQILGDRAPFMFYFMAIVAAKRFWGRGPALLATLLGGISAWYFILAPSFSFAIANRADALNLAAFLAIGAGISFLGEVAGRLASFKTTDGQSVKVRILRQTAVLVGAAAVLLGMVVMLLHEFRQRQEAEFWVTHTYYVLNLSESLLSVIKDAETSQRGFLLTGDEIYLAPYDAAVGSVPGRLKELKELTADNPRQQAPLAEISRLADERMTRLGMAIELYKSSQITLALAQIRTGQGRQVMDQLRSAVNAFRNEELDLLKLRQAAADVEASRERWVLGLGCGALIALLVLASAVIERETVRREEITGQLRRHADLLEQAHDSLLTCRLGGGIAYWSRGAATLYGYAREEALGRPPHDLLQSSHPYGIARIDALLERDGRWRGELTQTTKAGRKLTVEAQWALAVDAEGNKTMLEANRDITERKRAEAALAESELRYRELFERSESALVVYEIIYDAQRTPCDFRYININPAFERSTTRKSSQVIGRTAREVTPEIEDYWIKLFGAVAITGGPAIFEHYARHLGRYYSGIAYSPRANQVAVSFMDVTERKRAEEEVRRLNVELEERVRLRTAELESANQELEAFAHSVSHDLRAPLRGIDGWSLALLEDCNERLDPQGRKYLDRVRSEAQRMGKLIDDLLHLSRVGRTEIVLGPVDLTGLAQTIVGRLREANPGRSIEIIIAPGLKCIGDARLLEVALTNLFGNAVKFTGPCNSATLEFGQTELTGHLTFFVRDNGVGFDMTYAKMLFAPFQRLHKTSEFPGTGIGLATVQRVVHRHGGRIWADAKVGAGATFYFTLGVEPR